ncbi:hypothetical protein, partial [Halalkalibacter alkalisediminis]|uniref:hypothetical protein n=1 Tax=Halalkalibacter alkalisediminis TaxID=935616 RepID=UPI0023600F77
WGLPPVRVGRCRAKNESIPLRDAFFCVPSMGAIYRVSVPKSEGRIPDLKGSGWHTSGLGIKLQIGNREGQVHCFIKFITLGTMEQANSQQEITGRFPSLYCSQIVTYDTNYSKVSAINLFN